MAYNVSVMMSEPEDRWRWVQNGILLLRDEGLLYNPSSSELYWELGWMFQYKIAGQGDEAHLYYRQRWAAEMNDLLGGARADYARIESGAGADRLRNEYKLDAQEMKRLDAVYGPFDWRLPDTHALYWAWMGKKYATEKTSLSCDRMIYQAMASTFLQGQLRFRPEGRIYETLPYPEILPNVIKAFDSALSAHPEESIRTAYVHFLQSAVYVLHSLGREAEARRTFDLLTTRFPASSTPAYESLITAPPNTLGVKKE
jgi:hypothetical protein